MFQFETWKTLDSMNIYKRKIYIYLHLSFSDKKNVCLVLDQTLEGLIPSF